MHGLKYINRRLRRKESPMRAMALAPLKVFVLALLTLFGTVTLGSANHDPNNHKPSFIAGEIFEMNYDGVNDDLLTAGLGKSGLAGPAPTFLSAQNPTAAELRKLGIYNNYRALVDISTAGGYGVLYGPNIDAEGNDTLGEGLVSGKEFIAFSDNGSGRQNVTMMVQLPESFNPAARCIVTAPSSGSRGVYGAIATAGEWGLKNGCAVAYTDKGTGTGAHNLQENSVGLITGLRADADEAGKGASFTAKINANAE